jgi:putrescine aminotransferase
MSLSDARTPVVTGADVLALYRKHLGTGRAAVGQLLGGMVEVASQGPWITVADGRRYLDFGGYGVFLLGHRHPAVVQAVHDQIDTHPLATRVFLEPVAAWAAAALAAVTPPDLDYVHFVNSGSEATEAALKLARAHGKNAVITTRLGFHGKTLGALSVTANPLYQDLFQPLLPDVAEVNYGDLSVLQGVLAERAGRGCLIVEPVQGEGGVRIPPPGYLRGLAELCREHDAFLIVDEIQTGMGRLGTWWGVDTEGVVPDVLLVGKGLSGGVVPVAALVATAKSYSPFSKDPYLHTSTFGASPLACAAALAALKCMHREDIVARAATLGARLLAWLRECCARHGNGTVVEVRGRGLLLGIEFTEGRFVGEMVLELLDRGVLANHSLNASRVLRFTPPAVLQEQEIEAFCSAFNASIKAVTGA